jgi:endonuclease/exonuclease/phosphatase family metal-dependent hydrolase
MDVNQYMYRDLELLTKRVNDVAVSYVNHEAPLTMERSKAMFEAFRRRFGLEDFILSKFEPTSEMRLIIRRMLEKRGALRERLEDMLMLHVNESEFKAQIQTLLRLLEEHLNFLQVEFLPEVMMKLPTPAIQNVNHALEDRFHNTSFTHGIESQL